jgi:hypothetical protein
MNNSYTISTGWALVLATLALWELAWKGIALWRAARNNQVGWFIALLVINSVGILPIIYLLIHRPEGHPENYERKTPVSIQG